MYCHSVLGGQHSVLGCVSVTGAIYSVGISGPGVMFLPLSAAVVEDNGINSRWRVMCLSKLCQSVARLKHRTFKPRLFIYLACIIFAIFSDKVESLLATSFVSGADTSQKQNLRLVPGGHC